MPLENWQIALVIFPLAIFAGIWIANRMWYPADWWLKRSLCPKCDAWKLLPRPGKMAFTPIAPSRATATCSRCAEQWLIENTDGEPIIEGPRRRAVLPQLVYTTSLRTGNPVFKTDIGELEVGLFRRARVIDFEGIRTPRELLKRCYELGVDVERIELIEPFNSGTLEQQISTFMDSAGIDLPIEEGPHT